MDRMFSGLLLSIEAIDSLHTHMGCKQSESVLDRSLFQFRFEPGAARDRQYEASRSVVDRPSISGRL